LGLAQATSASLLFKERVGRLLLNGQRAKANADFNVLGALFRCCIGIMVIADDVLV
jgi:hypothetical protein